MRAVISTRIAFANITSKLIKVKENALTIFNLLGPSF